jgi:glycosyltransferase involved in cell wall biosynthesis
LKSTTHDPNPSTIVPYRAPPAAPAGAGNGSLALSLIVPAFDEEANIELLHLRIAAVFGERRDWELVLVDDGSRDRTAEVIRALATRDPRVVGVFLERNGGQSAALAAGLDEARGNVIATLDADLQNDPADLPLLLERLHASATPGCDAVVGYRLRRRDTFVRRASSRIANGIRNWISRDDIRDTGCSLKVFRAEALRTVPWFDGMHRFLPTLLRYQGFRVLEVPVSHHPRHAGRSKYGIRNRAWRAFQDLLAVRWMRGRMIRPARREVLRAR